MFAAFVNGLVLLAVSLSVAVAAVSRLVAVDEHDVLGLPMLVVGLVGGATNVAALLVLRGGATHSINMRGAYLEVLGDLLGSAAVVAGVVAVAHASGARVVAEGIETAPQHEAALEAGCDRAQGYLLGRPAPLEDLTHRFPRH